MISPRELRDLEAFLDAPKGPQPKIATEFESFDLFCDAVERLTGRDIDGREHVDSCSLDTAYDAWSSRFTPEEYAAGKRANPPRDAQAT